MKLQSLDSLATDVVADMYAGKLVFVQFPKFSNRRYWQNQIMSACQANLRLAGEDARVEEKVIEDDGYTPTELFEDLDVPADASIPRFLTEYGHDPIALAFTKPLSELSQWSEFIDQVTKEQKRLDDNDMSRMILVFCDSDLAPSLSASVSVSSYQFWNPVRWEELRLAAHRWLGASANDATLAWMIATYVGATGSDPECLQHLCVEQPRTLRDVLSIRESFITPQRRSSSALSNHHAISGSGAWRLPKQIPDGWIDDGLIGMSLDRGAVHTTSLMDEKAQEDHVRRAIWTEQSAGLLPLIMEISYRTNLALDSVINDTWRSRCAEKYGCTVEDTYYREPGDILSIVSDSRSDPLPRTIYKLLNELRRTRNKLAHLVPIELSPITEIWDMHLRPISN
jgi:hypothetical protein